MRGLLNRVFGRTSENTVTDFSTVIARSEALSASGNYHDAYRALQAYNREQPNIAVERAMVDTLLQARPQNTSPRPAQKSESRLAEHLCPPGQIPDVHANELSAELIKAALDAHGHLLVRGLVSPRDASSIADCIDQSLRARVEQEETASSTAPASPWYYPSPHFPGNHISYSRRNADRKYELTGSMPVLDSPRGTLQVLSLFNHMDWPQLLREYFGEDAVIAPRKWMFRHATPKQDADDGIGGGWHQDGQFMGEDIKTLNLWLALSHCGDQTDAPGIAVLPRRFTEVLEFGSRGATLNWTVGPELVAELARETPMLRPTFAPGDALIFDHLSLHRTGHAPGQTKSRHALESWFYASSATSGRPVIPIY